MFKQDFQLSGGDKNKGTVYLPNEESKNIPVIIYCHGWGGNRQHYGVTEKLCEKAILSNIAFVAFDFYGCGETGGDYNLMTYARWKNNLSDIFSWCAAQPFANANKIGCYSLSSGTVAALRFAAEDHRVAFIISVATAISLNIGLHDGGPAKIFADNCKELLSGGQKEFFGFKFGSDFYIDTISNAPIHTIKNIKCPVLFLQGKKDNPFRCADAKMAYQLMAYDGLPVSHIEIDEGDHGLTNVVDEAIEHIFNWIPPLLF